MTSCKIYLESDDSDEIMLFSLRFQFLASIFL